MPAASGSPTSPAVPSARHRSARATDLSLQSPISIHDAQGLIDPFKAPTTAGSGRPLEESYQYGRLLSLGNVTALGQSTVHQHSEIGKVAVNRHGKMEGIEISHLVLQSSRVRSESRGSLELKNYCCVGTFGDWIGVKFRCSTEEIFDQSISKVPTERTVRSLNNNGPTSMSDLLVLPFRSTMIDLRASTRLQYILRSRSHARQLASRVWVGIGAWVWSRATCLQYQY
eukprot:COSAG02_NODE_3649_length_6431_cov_488.315781_5_plen_228_part_00